MALSTKFLAVIFFFASHAFGLSETNTPPQCSRSTTSTGCHNKSQALNLKLIAIASILTTSVIGVCLPIFSRAVPALKPDTDLFVLVKAFASGVILATGYMHVMPDSFDDLRSKCLPENPWKKFPFTTFVAMLSAIFTLMMDSYAMSYYRKRNLECGVESNKDAMSTGKVESQTSGHFHINNGEIRVDENASQLLRYRVVAQVLELGIVVHSIVIGLSMGASENPCTIRPLVAALCFHQLFEGMGLGGCILQAEYGAKVKGILVFFFSATTPFGIALGIGLSNVYSENSPTALIVVGLLNASSAGLLNYMALVDLLAYDFMGDKLQRSMKLQTCAYIAVLLGAAYNRSDDYFSGFNDIPIPEDIIDQFGGSTDPIDLEDVHDDADTQTTIGSSTKRKATKQKAKCWDHFEFVPTDKIVNDLPEFKVQCKHCQEKFAWQKEIGTTHLNRHYKKCQYKYGDLDTNQAQLQFGSPGAGSSTPTLNNWIYSQELM
ncbi:Zinc transporter 7 [Abeliophyllum distichum]|uniref:Zinc transporter 7 n=1 Tax=Abeliophyllum distichum TaxID=126358 RepID=A0ABD1UHF3_9LAMI